jgi:hypothetical protein
MYCHPCQVFSALWYSRQNYSYSSVFCAWKTGCCSPYLLLVVAYIALLYHHCVLRSGRHDSHCTNCLVVTSKRFSTDDKWFWPSPFTHPFSQPASWMLTDYLSPYVFLLVLTRRYSVKYFYSEFYTTSLCPSSLPCPAHHSLLDFINLTVLHDLYTSQSSWSCNILFFIYFFIYGFVWIIAGIKKSCVSMLQ